MQDKKNQLLVPYDFEYQIGPMEETYKGVSYFDLKEYYKHKHKDKVKKNKRK